MDKNLRLQLRNVFYDTQKKIEEDEFLKEQNKIALKNTFVYKEEEDIGTESLNIYEGNVSVVDMTTAGAVEFDNTAILNFASPILVGGEPWHGFTTQEEVINRSTTLFPTLNSESVKRDYYSYFKRNNDGIFTDRMIISRNIYIIKDDELIPNNLLKQEYLKVDVITSPAPDLNKKKLDKETYKKIYKSRIKKIFRLAALYKNTTIIVGAFGCGAFKNPPEWAADCFREVLFEENYKNYFENVVFAIPTFGNDKDINYNIFKERLCE